MDLLSFEDMITMDDEEVDNLLADYKRFKQERANVQHEAFKHLPRYPQLVIDSIEYLRLNYGFLNEGIFRINGDAKTVEKIRSMYESGVEDVYSELGNSIENYDVATALKAYFRLLEDPLIPEDIYEEMKNIADSGDDMEDQVKALNRQIRKIKAPNLQVLSYVMMFFKEVIAEEDTNKMSAKNMGTCLTMSITRFDPDANPGGTTSLVAMVEIGLSTKIIAMMLNDIDFEQFLSREQYQDMKSRSCYKPTKLGKPPKRKGTSKSQQSSNLSRASQPLNKSTKDARQMLSESYKNKPPGASGSQKLKPKVPPRVPPRAGRGKKEGFDDIDV